MKSLPGASQTGSQTLEVTTSSRTRRRHTPIAGGKRTAKRERDARRGWAGRETVVILNTHTKAASSMTHHGASVSPSLTTLFLSLSSPLSLPPSYSPSHAKSFPRFPFLFGLLMWCLECRREGAGGEARGCVAETRITCSCFIASQLLRDSKKSRIFMLYHH